MNIPNVPTDNLYKFLSIFGLILFVFSSYMLYEIPQNLNTEIDLMKIKEEALKNYNLKKDTDNISELKFQSGFAA